MTDGFEIDRTVQGKMKVNIVSAANLIALISLLGVALGTWNALTSRVDVMSTKVDLFQGQIVSLRADLQTSVITRDNASRDFSQKVEQIGNRLTAVETILQRVERRLEPSPATIPAR